MRRSSIEGDAGFLPYRHELSMGCRHRIFLNGVEQQKVFTADESEGLVVRGVLDGTGNLQCDPNRPGEAWREQVHGDVRINVEFPAD